MADVLFAAPFAMDNTMRFLRTVGGLPGVRLGVLSQDPIERFPEDVRAMMQGFAQVSNALEVDAIVGGVRDVARQLGGNRGGGNIDALFGILEQAQEPLAVVRERLGLPGLSAEAAHNFRDKARMKDVLRKHGLPCAGHGMARSAAEALQVAEQLGYPLVAKPPAGAGAKATQRVDRPADLQSYLRSVKPSAASPLLLEQFVTGREFSFDSVSIGGRHVFHSISCYAPAPLKVLAEPWIQWAVLLPRDIATPEFAAIHDAGPRALTALGMGTGITHMEWFLRDDGSIAISEVAARPPGAQFMTLLSHAHGIDFYRAWAELMVYGHFTPPTRRFAAGAVYLRGQGSGKVVAVHGFEQAQRELGDLVVEAKLPQPGQEPSGSYEGEGYVVLRHADTEVVSRGLQRVASLLRVELG